MDLADLVRARAVKRALRDPLVPFFAIGVALFAVDRALPDPDPEHRITLDEAFVRGLEEEATRRTGHVPDEAQSEALVSGWVREEILFREARALGLDRDDLIVRRRLVQKIELLLAAQARWEEPTDEDLAAYLREHADDFRRDERTTVRLCFFSQGDAHARALAVLAAPDAMECDPHLPGDHFAARTQAQLTQTVGSAFAEAAATAPVGTWSGPVETPRGVYLLQVEQREPARAATLDEVRGAVRGRVVEERRAAVVHAREQEIAASYVVERAP